MPDLLTLPRARAAIAGLALALLLPACSVFKRQAPAPVVAAPPPVVHAPVITPRMLAAEEALRTMAELHERLYKVAAPLLIDNADLCKNQARNLLGFTAKNRHSYPGEYNDAAHAALGMGERLEVTTVLAGSGAARAGLRPGDVLMAAEGKDLPVGANAETLAATIFGPLASNHAAIKLSIERGGNAQVLNVPVTHACGFRVELGNADNINAYADGQRIMVTRGMLRVTTTDDELAYVLAADMAHNMLGHAAMQRSAFTVGSVIDNLVNVHPDLSMLIGSSGIKAMPPELDAAADHLALYLLARAGYPYEHAGHFWKTLSAQYPQSILNGYVANHPGTSVRLAAIEKTVVEIKAKQAGKKPLVP